MIPKGDLDV